MADALQSSGDIQGQVRSLIVRNIDDDDDDDDSIAFQYLVHNWMMCASLVVAWIACLTCGTLTSVRPSPSSAAIRMP